MTLEQFLEVSSYGVQTAMLVSAPVLLMGLGAGILVSILQAATQINDAALSFIPKMAAVVLSLILFGNWMIQKMSAFAVFALNQIPAVTH